MSDVHQAATQKPSHRYRLGQRVTFNGGGTYSVGGQASFTVTRLTPPVGKVFGYRIKGDADNYERTADERQLTAVSFD